MGRLMTEPSHFTPTEARLLAILADGGPHSREELRRALYDDWGDVANIRAHLSNLRRKLPPGAAIACELRGVESYYRYVKVQGKQ